MEGACKNDAAVFGVSRPLTFSVYKALAVSAGCFSLVAGMAPAEQNGGDFIGYGTFVFIDNSENIMAIISHFHCFRKGIFQIPVLCIY